MGDLVARVSRRSQEEEFERGRQVELVRDELAKMNFAVARAVYSGRKSDGRGIAHNLDSRVISDIMSVVTFDRTFYYQM